MGLTTLPKKVTANEELAEIHSILAMATHVTKERAEQYGSPLSATRHIAKLWTALLSPKLKDGEEISHVDMNSMMILLKLVRVSNDNLHKDSWIDIAGYSGVAWSSLVQDKFNDNDE